MSVSSVGPGGQRYVDIADRKQWDRELFQLSPDVFGTDLIAIFGGMDCTSVGVWLFQSKVAERDSSPQQSAATGRRLSDLEAFR